MNPEHPHITFGMIVLNGEPFVRYNLRALYPFAHQIIVVEGAAPSAVGIATPEGHSRDGTLETLQRFKAEEDPENKLEIITRDGFWEEKDEMSQAYARRATGNYLWQIDSDEFYLPDDIRRVIDCLSQDPSITAMSFRTLTFWGSLDYTVDGWFLRRGARDYRRLFCWGSGYTYVTHRPPTVYDEQGRDLHDLHCLDASTTARMGIRMFHYSLLLPSQVHAKSDYYDHADWIKAEHFGDWARETYDNLRKPLRAHNWYELPGWLERYRGPHPPQVEKMWEAVRAGQWPQLQPRRTDDIERLLRSPGYRAKRFAVKYQDYLDRTGLPHRVRRELMIHVMPLFRPLYRPFVKRYRRNRMIRQKQAELHGQLQHMADTGQPVRLVVGAGSRFIDGWTLTDQLYLDVVRLPDWQRVVGSVKVDRILAEHVFEHLTIEQFRVFLRLVPAFLSAGGFIRLAVPDGYHPSPAYREYVRPGGSGAGADDHKVFYNYKLITDILEAEGYNYSLLEYFDENGDFHEVEWAVKDGPIHRSAHYDERNKEAALSYTSLIIDFWPR